MGSVGVKQAEMAKHDIKSNRGNKRRRRPRKEVKLKCCVNRDYIPATIAQPIAIVGITIAERLLACFAI